MKTEKSSGFDLSICYFGFALFWAYRWVFFNTNVLVPDSYRGTFLLSTMEVLGSVVQALTILVVVIAIIKDWPPLLRDHSHAIAIVILGTLATPLIVMFGNVGGTLGLVLTVVGWLAREMASALLVCLWAKVFCSATERNVCLYMSASVAIAAVIVFVLAFFPMPVVAVCTSLMPAGSVALFYAARSKLARTGTEYDLPKPEEGEPVVKSSLWRLLIAIVAYTAVFAVSMAEVTNALAQSEQTAVSLTLLGNFLAGVAVVLIVVITPKMTSVARVYQCALPIMVLSLVLMSMQGVVHIDIANFAMSLGFTLFDIISWIVLIDIAHYTKTSVLRAFLLGRFCSLLGMFLGRLLAMFFLAQGTGFHTGVRASFPLIGVLIIVVVAFLVVRERNLFYNEQLSDEIDEEFLRTEDEDTGDAVQDYWHKKIDAVVAEYALSPRESEVLALLARGRTNAFIQKELVISKHTVDSHVIHIYRKCGVHSKQEMLTLIEETDA